MDFWRNNFFLWGQSYNWEFWPFGRVGGETKAKECLPHIGGWLPTHQQQLLPHGFPHRSAVTAAATSYTTVWWSHWLHVWHLREMLFENHSCIIRLNGSAAFQPEGGQLRGRGKTHILKHHLLMCKYANYWKIINWSPRLDISKPEDLMWLASTVNYTCENYCQMDFWDLKKRSGGWTN